MGNDIAAQLWLGFRRAGFKVERSFDYYLKYTRDILNETWYSGPLWAEGAQRWLNGAEIDNKGLS